jgi:hypothetical protein
MSVPKSDWRAQKMLLESRELLMQAVSANQASKYVELSDEVVSV